MRVDALRRAIEKLDGTALARRLEAEPGFLRQNPEYSAQLLSLALRVIGMRGDMKSRGDAARAQLERDRMVFDLLLTHGASVNCSAGLEDLPPLFVALQMNHPLFADALIRAGADISQRIEGFSLSEIAADDPEMRKLLRNARRRRKQGPASRPGRC